MHWTKEKVCALTNISKAIFALPHHKSQYVLRIVSWQIIMAHETEGSLLFLVIHYALTRHVILKRETHTSNPTSTQLLPRRTRNLINPLDDICEFSLESQRPFETLDALALSMQHIETLFLRDAYNAFFISLRLRVTRWVVVVRPWVQVLQTACYAEQVMS